MLVWDVIEEMYLLIGELNFKASEISIDALLEFLWKKALFQNRPKLLETDFPECLSV